MAGTGLVDEQMFVFTLEAPAERRPEVVQLIERPRDENPTPCALLQKLSCWSVHVPFAQRRAPTAPTRTGLHRQQKDGALP